MWGGADGVGALGARNDIGDARIVRVLHPREELVLDLVVETAEQPGQEHLTRSEVDGRLDLVHRPDALLGLQLLG